MTKKYRTLYEAHKSIMDENAALKKDNEALKSQRRGLVQELDEKAKHDKETKAVISALSENLVKSLKDKHITNMKPDEKDAIYYMLERYIQLTIFG